MKGEMCADNVLQVIILTTKTFARWQGKEQIANESLRRAVAEMRQGLIDADLGGGLVKKRLARSGAGKSAGYRTLLATNKHDKWFFIYGFAKNERDNISRQEVRALRALVKSLLVLNVEQIHNAKLTGELQEIGHG